MKVEGSVPVLKIRGDAYLLIKAAHRLSDDAKLAIVEARNTFKKIALTFLSDTNRRAVPIAATPRPLRGRGRAPPGSP